MSKVHCDWCQNEIDRLNFCKRSHQVMYHRKLSKGQLIVAPKATRQVQSLPQRQQVDRKVDRSFPLEDITPEIVAKIAGDYKVSIGFVTLELETLKNYCKSKGRVYKDHRAALRNFVINDMKRMIERRATQRGGVADGSSIGEMGSHNP